MGVHLALQNFDELMHRYGRVDPVIINDREDTTADDKERFNRQIYTKFEHTDLLSNLPMCECGKTYGEHNVNPKNPVICPKCLTPVQSTLDQNLEPRVWLRAPNGVRALINPEVWTMLSKRFMSSGFDVIRYLTDTGYQPSVSTPKIMPRLQALNIPRGLNNFVDNFDAIIEALYNLKDFRPKKGTVEPLQHLLKIQRNCIFSQYLPLPNRSLLVIEETNVGTYVDPIVTGAIDAIQTMVGCDTVLSSHSVRVKENRTIKTIAQLATFYDGLYKSLLATKEGIFRKHVFGTRSHFSFRAVISSLTDNHDYDEIHIPWGIGVSVFRLHLMNKLLRRGYFPNSAIALLNEHSQKYHPLLDELFNELITESPYKGVHCVFQRNPSLERASAQAMFITKVKTDPDIPTVSLSILSVTGYNADFDGDQLNGTLSIDNMTAEQLYALAPHKSTFNFDSPRKVSRNLSMPKPVVATIANWVHHPDGEFLDPEKKIRMDAIPEFA